MTRFDFSFMFLDTQHTAGCHVIPPPTDTQYHILLRSPLLEAHGTPIIFVMTKPWHFSFPSTSPNDHPDGPKLVASLWDGLRTFLADNPRYLL
jgi:hypothetical protein